MSARPSQAPELMARRRRLGLALGALTIVGATVYLFWPLFAGLPFGTVHYFEWDVPEQYWPDLVYLCESIHRGELPYWNPFDRGGYPYYADPQAGLYHPLHWAICGVAGPSPGLGWATARVVLGFLLAGAFGLLWLRRIGASWSGAIAGAVLIEAAPFMRHNWELNLTLAMAWMPLVLWAADRLATERRAFDGVVLALALSLCGWIGSPPALWLTGSLAGLYLAFRLGEEWRRHGRKVARGAPALLVAAALTFGLLAEELVPGATLAEHSVQAGRSFESIAAGALEGEDLWALVWPRSGNHLYVGWLALGLVPFALHHERRRLALFFVAVGALAVLMSTGGLVFRAAFELVPGVRLFRLPHRYEAWLGPAAGAIVALGLSDAAHRTLGGEVATRLRIGAAVAAVVGALALIALRQTASAPTPGLFLLAVAAILGARTLRRPFDCGSPIWGVVLAALALVDVTQALPPERHMRADDPPGSAEVARRMLAHAPGTDAEWRLMDEFGIAARAGTRLRRRDFRGYQDPLLLASYERVVDSLRAHPALVPQFNVRFALQGPHFIHGWNRHYLPPPTELRAALRSRVRYEDEAERSVTELLDALPFAYFVPADAVEIVDGRDAALARVKALAPSAIAILEDADAAAAASIRPGALGAAAGVRPAAAARDLALSPDRLRFAIRAPARGVVVVNEAAYPGWRATVDGREAPILRANGFVRAVPVDAGERVIEMTFRPADGVRWRQVFVFALLGVLLALLSAPLASRLRAHRRS